MAVGRAQNVEVRITDISVSRVHSFFTFDPADGSVKLTDNYSKFGTLILVDRPLRIEYAENFYIQVGRSLLSFNCHNKQNCW